MSGGRHIAQTRFYERVYQAAWNQYCYLSESLNGINRQLEFLLLISGVFFAAYAYLSISFPSVFLPSLVGFSIIYLLSLYFILPRLRNVPWVGHHNLEFQNYAKKSDVEGLYKQLVIETYKCEYDLRIIFKRRSVLFLWVIVVFIFSAFFPVVILISNFSQIIGLISGLYLGILILIFFKKFKTPILKYFKSGDVPGKGSYRCLYCRKSYDIDEKEKLKKCSRCREGNFVKNEPLLFRKFSRIEKILFLFSIINILILLIIDGPAWGLFAITLWIFFYLILSCFLIVIFIRLLNPVFIKITEIVKKTEEKELKKKIKKKTKKTQSKVGPFLNKLCSSLLADSPKIFALLLSLLIIFNIFSPIVLLSSYMAGMTHIKSETNRPKLNKIVEELTRYDSTEEEKAISILKWYDAYSDNIFNDYQLSSLGIGKFLFRIERIEFYSGGLFIGVRTYDDSDAPWILTSRYGHCGEYALLFRQMACAAGLEARKITCLGENHCWNEVLIDGEWIIVDPTDVYLTTRNGYNKSETFIEEKTGGNVSYVEAEWLNGKTVDVTYRYTNLINITMTIFDVNGKPIDDAKINIISKNRENMHGDIGIDDIYTNQSGEYKITIGGGYYEFKAQKDDYSGSAIKSLSEDKINHYVNITIQ